MNNSSILLSVSMLISGREEMKKSLDSLMYFKDAFPTEIILVDTGCNEEQRTLAEQYADQVLDFEWCNDFAKARNVGLKAARGEWFLYLDDDEWFENPKEIIDFFESGEYKRYNSATYKVRNYLRTNGSLYEDTTATRMIKLEKNTVFTGKIHEYLYPFKIPTKHFADFVHHYGYVYQTEEARKQHAERNIAPLLEMIEEEPKELRWACQLAQEYFGIEKYDETVATCEKCLAMWTSERDYKIHDLRHVGAAYAYLLISLEVKKEYQREEQWLKKAFEEPRMPEPTIAYFCLAAVRLYSITNQYELCSSYLGKYVRYAQKLQNDVEAISLGAALIVSGVFQKHLLFPTLLLGMESAIRLQKHDLAREAFFMIDWTDERMLSQTGEEKKILDACCSVDYHPLWAEILQTLVARKDGIKEMYVVFLETEITYKQQEDAEKLSKLYRLVAEIDFEHRYILCCRILWTERNPELDAGERKQQLLALFTELFDKYANELFDIKSEIWDLAKRMEIPMEPNLLKIGYRVWRRMLERWSREATLEEFVKWNARILTWQTVADIRYQLFNVKYEEGYLRTCQKSQIALEELEKQLWKYADDVIALYRPYYKEFVFNDAVDMLPEEVQLALKLKRLQEYRQQGNAKEVLIQIKECITIYSPMEATINDYASRVRDEIQMQIQKQSAEKTELENLVISLKSVAKLRIQRGEWQAAEEILHQIQVCMPEDGEVEELLEQVAEMHCR